MVWDANPEVLGCQHNGLGKPTLLRVVFPFYKSIPFERVGFPLEGRPPKRCGKTTQPLWEANPSSGCLPFLKKRSISKGGLPLGGKTTQWLWEDDPNAVRRLPKRCGKTTQHPWEANPSSGCLPFFSSAISKGGLPLGGRVVVFYVTILNIFLMSLATSLIP